MKIKEISFKITTSERLKCNKCHGNIIGKEGYVKLSLLNPETPDYWTTDFFLKLCHNCLEEIINDYLKKRKTVKEDYQLLLKKNIIKKLR